MACEHTDNYKNTKPKNLYIKMKILHIYCEERYDNLQLKWIGYGRFIHTEKITYLANKLNAKKHIKLFSPQISIRLSKNQPVKASNIFHFLKHE